MLFPRLLPLIVLAASVFGAHSSTEHSHARRSLSRRQGILQDLGNTLDGVVKGVPVVNDVADDLNDIVNPPTDEDLSTASTQSTSSLSESESASSASSSVESSSTAVSSTTSTTTTSSRTGLLGAIGGGLDTVVAPITTLLDGPQETPTLTPTPTTNGPTTTILDPTSITDPAPASSETTTTSSDIATSTGPIPTTDPITPTNPTTSTDSATAPDSQITTPPPDTTTTKGGILDPITSNLSPVIDPVTSIVNTLTSVIVDPVTSVIDPVTSVIVDPVTSIINTLTSVVVDPVTSIIDPVTSVVVDPVTSIIDPVTSVVVDPVTSIIDPVTSVVNPVTSVIVDPVTSIINTLTSVVVDPVTSVIPITSVLPPITTIDPTPTSVEPTSDGPTSVPGTTSDGPTSGGPTSLPETTSDGPTSGGPTSLPETTSDGPTSGGPTSLPETTSDRPTSARPTSVLDPTGPSANSTTLGPTISFPEPTASVNTTTTADNSDVTQVTVTSMLISTISIDPGLSFVLTETTLAHASVVTTEATRTLTDPDEATTEIESASPEAATTLNLAAPLPTGIPARIFPREQLDLDSDLSSYTLISILFNEELNWRWVVQNTQSSSQIFALLPVLIMTALDITADQVKSYALQVYIPATYRNPQDVAMLGTTWLGYVPSELVDTLAALIKTKSSSFYTGVPPGVARDLADHVVPGFSLLSVPDENKPSDGNDTTTLSSSNDKSRQDAIIGVVSALGAVALLVLVFLVYRSMKRRKQLAHRRLSDPPNEAAGVRPSGRQFDQDSVGGARRRSFYYAEDSLRGYEDRNEVPLQDETSPTTMSQRRNAGPISTPVLNESTMHW